MKPPPWIWLVILFVLPLFAWAAIALAASRANIQKLELPPRAHPVRAGSAPVH